MAEPELTEQPKAFTVPPAPELAAVKGQMGGVPGVTDYAAARRGLRTSAQASEAGAKALQRSTELGQEIGMAQLGKEQYLADAKADIARQEREAAQKIERGLDETRAKFPYPEFHPTKDNVETLTGLFSIIGLVGMAMGGAGKQSATLALNSMGGMMKGWQQGRSDLFKREKEEFDKNMQRTKAILDDAYRDADRAYKTLAYNRQEAEALAAQSAAKLGGQVGRHVLEKQGVENYYKYVDGVKKDLQHAEDIAQRRELAMLKKEGGGALPKDKETQNQHRSRFEVIKNIEEIESLLKDPKFRRLINPTTQITPELLQRLQKGYPELANKLARVQAIEFQIGGKALTQTEQRILEPIYGWRGKTAAALEGQLAETKRGMQATQDYVESDFPGLKSRSQAYEKIYRGGGDLKSLPEPEAEKPVYAVGDIISKAGKRLKVNALIKNERGDIIDYDVEEVK